MNNVASRTRPSNRPRRLQRSADGFLYVAVLFTTLIVMVAVTAALTISTSSLRGETNRNHRGDALRFAESEIHRQVALMRSSSQWRSTATHGVFSSWYPVTIDGVSMIETGQVRFRFEDVDGDLDDDHSDPVDLTVHAQVGSSEAALRVQLESDPTPLDLLSFAVTASDDLRFESGGTLSCEWPVQVNDDCRTSSWGMLTTPQLHCSGNVPMTLRGDLVGAAVTMPTEDVVDTWVTQGTQISAASIPQDSGELIIEDRLLTPNDNPFGTTDPNGIYWIDASGLDVVISHCRIDATLAIRNAGQVELGGGITWSYPNQPSLILVTDAVILLDDVESTLDENARGVNFNPSSSPYRQTLSNASTTDTYPTELRGVIYTTSNVRMNPLIGDATLRLTGILIGRDIRIEGHMTVTPLHSLLDNPPQGLSDPTPMQFVRGSFRRIESP